MNISPINSTPLPGMTTRSVAADAGSAELRQTASQQRGEATQSLTRQSVEQTQKSESTRQALEDAIEATNDFVKPFNNGIQFQLDDDSGKTIVKVVDLSTDEVVRQFPSEEMLAIAKAIEQMKGLLIQQKA